MPIRNGAFLNHSITNKNVKTLPVYLKQLGYRVALANRTHIRPRQDYPIEYIGATLPPIATRYREHRQEGLDTKAIDTFLTDHVVSHPDQPLCLILAASGPHVRWQKNDGYDPDAIPLSPNQVDTPATRAAMTRYYSDITNVDRKLGDVLASVTRHGFEANSLFIYTSDQGAEWPFAKWNLYDAGIRTPFIARWQGRIDAGSITDAMISFCDLLPTFVEVAGGEPVTDIDGRSVLSVLLGESAHHRNEVYASHSGDGDYNDSPRRCNRTHTHMLILNLNPQRLYSNHFATCPDRDHDLIWDTWAEISRTDETAAAVIHRFRHRPEVELYDLSTDPFELNNVAAKPAKRELVARLRKKVEDWMEQQGDKGLKTEEQARQRLEGLYEALRKRLQQRQKQSRQH